MSFRQYAQDTFSVEVTGPYHCGPNHDSPKTFNYEVELFYHGDALDDKGFLIDNLTFRDYFNGIRETALSCELLCKKAAHDLYALTNGRAEKCRVALWALPGHVKVEYDCYEA